MSYWHLGTPPPSIHILNIKGNISSEHSKIQNSKYISWINSVKMDNVVISQSRGEIMIGPCFKRY